MGRQRMVAQTQYFLAIVAATALIAGCGGGAGTTVTPSHATAPAAHALQASVAIHVPPKPGSRRVKPAYLSAYTNSITVAVDGGAPVETDLTPSSPNCGASSANGYSCTVSILASTGSHTFAFVTYDQPGGKGHVLSTNMVTQTLSANSANVVDVTLSGVPATAQIEIASGTLIANATTTGFSSALGGTETILVNALDADGEAIIGAGAPTITGTLTGSSGGAFSVASVNGAANTFTLTNPATAGSATLNMSVSGSSTPFATSILTAAPLVTTPTTLAGTFLQTLQFSISETNYAGDVSEGNNCGGIANLVFGTLVVPTVLTPLTGGMCTVTVHDQLGQTATTTVTSNIATPAPNAAPLTENPTTYSAKDERTPVAITVSE